MENSLYTWDEKSIGLGEEKAIKDNDHYQDAKKYFIMAIWKHVIRLLPVLKE